MTARPRVTTLTRGEQWLVAAVAGRRQELNLNRHDSRKFKGDGLAIVTEGVGAECAVARFLDRYWDAVHDEPGPGDVGAFRPFEVRHTNWPQGGLRAHPEDPDDVPVVLVTGVAPVCRIHGWLWAAEAKQQRFWDEHKMHRNPCFLVPQDSPLIRDMREFPNVRRPEAGAA